MTLSSIALMTMPNKMDGKEDTRPTVLPNVKMMGTATAIYRGLPNKVSTGRDGSYGLIHTSETVRIAWFIISCTLMTKNLFVIPKIDLPAGTRKVGSDKLHMSKRM